MKHPFLASALSLVLSTNALASGPSCEQIFDKDGKVSASQPKKAPTVEEAIQNIKQYRETVMGQILERDFVIEPFLTALIAKEHILLVGPPGNAKTTLAKILLSNVVDDHTGTSFFYSMQMNKEITLSDTHGSINYKTMSDKGVVERNYNEGVLGAKLAFIDESFDIRPGALRNLLDVLAERSHSQGTKQHKGLTELVIAATNKTLPEVYQEHNNTEAPRALIDRFAFTILVPKEMESIKSDRAIFRGERAQAKPVHQISFADLDAIRSLVPKVKIPDYIADLAAMVHYRLAPELEAREVKSMEQYREKVQNGEHSLPPFRASKYMSPRTLGKAGNILKAIVVLDYVEKGGQRSLTATTEDLSKLRAFYQMGGPKDQFLDKQLARALKEEEKEQIKSVKTEREVVNPIFDETLKGFNEAIAGYKLQEVDRMAKDYSILPNTEKRKLMDVLKYMFHQGVDSLNKTDKEEITPDVIAASASVELVQGYVKTLFSEKATNILEQWQKELGYSSKKVLTAKQMRKQQFRYGYGEKRDVKNQGKLPRETNSKSKSKSKSNYEQVKVFPTEETNLGDKPNYFEIVGDDIFFVRSGMHPTWITNGQETKFGNAEWDIYGMLTFPLANNGIAVAFAASSQIMVSSNKTGFRIHGAPQNHGYFYDKVKVPGKDSYYMLEQTGVIEISNLNSGTPTETIISGLPSTYFIPDVNPLTQQIFTYSNYDGKAEIYNISGHEAVKEFDFRGVPYPSLVDNDQRSRAFLLSKEAGLVFLGHASGSRFLIQHDFVKKNATWTSADGVENVSISPDRKSLLLTYKDLKRVEIYSVEALANIITATQTFMLPSPEKVLTTPSGSDIGSFYAAKFSDDGQKIVVAGEKGFLIFE